MEECKREGDEGWRIAFVMDEVTCASSTSRLEDQKAMAHGPMLEPHQASAKSFVSAACTAGRAHKSSPSSRQSQHEDEIFLLNGSRPLG